MAGTKTPDRLAAALLETADGMKRVGVLGAAAHRKITLHHLGDEPARRAITGAEIRKLRGRSSGSD
jgi:putative transcriptional regulator